MRQLSYAVWEEGGLYYWTVQKTSATFQGGDVCTRGVATDLIRARAEAIAVGVNLATEDDARLAAPQQRTTPAGTSHIR